MRDNPDFVNGVKATVDLAGVPLRAVRIGANYHTGIEATTALSQGAYGDAAIGYGSLLAGTGATYFLKGFNVKSDLFLNSSSLATSKSTEYILDKDCFTCVN